jgi:hypothetical protein
LLNTHYFCNFGLILWNNGMKKIIIIIALLFGTLSSMACTSAVVSASVTKNGRPLLWKNRDTDSENNKVERVEAHDGRYEYVALFNAQDMNLREAWMGFNEKGFAIMNTASYNLNDDNVKDMDKEGLVMTKALESCTTVDDFEKLLKELPKPLGIEANFGVIDAEGNGAYFEAGNYSYVKFDLKDSPNGILTRTNYSYSGRKDEGMGYIREENEKELLAKHIARRDITPAVFTEELSRSYYHSLIGRDFSKDSLTWMIDQDFIPRKLSSATTVIEGVKPGECPWLTTMWIGLGFPPCSEISPVWLGKDGVPEALRGTLSNGHSPQCDKVNQRKDEVFSIQRGNGKHYFDMSKLYNSNHTGYCQILVPKDMETYRQGYKEIERRRQILENKNK